MTTYYVRDGAIYTTKTMCNLVETWQHEARVYPDELIRTFPQDWTTPEQGIVDRTFGEFQKRQGRREFRAILADLERFRKSAVL